MTPESMAKNDTEDGHQMALFQWAALNLKKFPQLEWLHAIPNGGNRDARSGAKMKATGARKGVWDVFLPVPVVVNGVAYHGLYIEMKKPKTAGKAAGRPTPEQLKFQKHLQHFNYANVICYTWTEARDVILSYLQTLPADHKVTYHQAMSEDT
jgi:hypothetical protein